jgi:hypothetical protein
MSNSENGTIKIHNETIKTKGSPTLEQYYEFLQENDGLLNFGEGIEIETVLGVLDAYKDLVEVMLTNGVVIDRSGIILAMDEQFEQFIQGSNEPLLLCDRLNQDLILHLDSVATYEDEVVNRSELKEVSVAPEGQPYLRTTHCFYQGDGLIHIDLQKVEGISPDGHVRVLEQDDKHDEILEAIGHLLTTDTRYYVTQPNKVVHKRMFPYGTFVELYDRATTQDTNQKSIRGTRPLIISGDILKRIAVFYPKGKTGTTRYHLIDKDGEYNQTQDQKLSLLLISLTQLLQSMMDQEGIDESFFVPLQFTRAILTQLINRDIKSEK